LLILGVSARAAAWSALRAGAIRPYCVDLFADADLQHLGSARLGSAQRLAASAYPHGFVEAAGQAPPGPWMYTGALENHPDILTILARERTLWGNSAEVVRQVRAPARVGAILREAGIPCPAFTTALPKDQTKRWLVKPLQSAGGAKIRWWRGGAVPHACYCQEWIDGVPCSALFVGLSETAMFLGATRQLIGVSWLRAKPFRYCGNVGPLVFRSSESACLQRIGNVLVKALALRGFFGVDFILNQDGVWPVEINPRYTAAIEVLERAAQMSFFDYHRQAFTRDGGVCLDKRHDSSRQVVGRVAHGKAILFAKAPLRFPSTGPWQDSLRHSWTDVDGPDYADIPHAGSFIHKGQPILTLFAHANTPGDCSARLRAKARALDRCLFGQ
jgi:predicted ATP-grasp superfamily ATP-dependent carboligase